MGRQDEERAEQIEIRERCEQEQQDRRCMEYERTVREKSDRTERLELESTRIERDDKLQEQFMQIIMVVMARKSAE